MTMIMTNSKTIALIAVIMAITMTINNYNGNSNSNRNSIGNNNFKTTRLITMTIAIAIANEALRYGTPYEKRHGSTPDISAYIIYHFWQPILFTQLVWFVHPICLIMSTPTV